MLVTEREQDYRKVLRELGDYLHRVGRYSNPDALPFPETEVLNAETTDQF